MKKFFILLSALLFLTSCDFNPIRLSNNLISKDFAIEVLNKRKRALKNAETLITL